MKLWLQTLSGRKLIGGQAPHAMLHDYAEELDQLSERLGAQPLSAFLDYTEFTRRLAADPKAEGDLDAAGKIEDMQWFDAQSGLEALRRLEQHLRKHPESLELEAGECRDLLRELQTCTHELETAAAAKGRFHLAVVF